MKTAAILALLSMLTFPAAAEEGALSDVEIWNQGVEFYQQGDVTNALRVLRPLVLSRTHGPRAAEIVSKLAYDNGDFEESARLAQIALRATPEDERVNRNFTRAADGLPALRERRRVEAALKAAQGKDPGALLLAATREARTLMVTAGTFRTNAAPVAVAIADRLSSSVEKMAETWIPVREKVAQSVTNQEQAATILQQLDQAEQKTRKAAQELGDLSADGYSTLSDVEHDLTRFLKLTILPPAALEEDLVAQSNAWQDVALFNGRDWQPEALDYTRSFRTRFPAWARAYEQQAQSETNRPPFTAEDQAKISALATELEKLQLECCEKALPPQQKKALDVIRQIQELLPKDKNGGGQSGQPPPDQQNPEQQNQDQQKPDQNQQIQDDRQQDLQGNQKQEQDPNQQQGEENQPESKAQAGEEEKPEDKELEAVLKKAQERNDEHEAEKKARMRKAALPPNEKDW